MSGSTTPYYSFNLPSIGGNQDSWGNLLNANWTTADNAIHTLASGYLPLTGGGTINGHVSVIGNLDATAVTVGSGGLVVQANASVAGELDVAGPLTVGGNQLVGGTLTTRAGMSCGGGLSISGAQVSDFDIYRVAPYRYLQWESQWNIAFNDATGDTTWNAPGTQNMLLDGSGNLSVRGAVTAAGPVQARGGLTFMGAGGDGAVFQFSPNWYYDWNSTNGNLGWMLNGTLFWFHRATDQRCYNNLGPVGGIGAYENNSDARGKEDIADASLGLAEILRLRPVTFKRRPRRQMEAQTPRTELGFIAQELREVIPEAVSVVGFELPDGSGGIDSSDPTLATTLDPIVAALVNCCKELAQRVADLEALRLA